MPADRRSAGPQRSVTVAVGRPNERLVQRAVRSVAIDQYDRCSHRSPCAVAHILAPHHRITIYIEHFGASTYWISPGQTLYHPYYLAHIAQTILPYIHINIHIKNK